MNVVQLAQLVIDWEKASKIYQIEGTVESYKFVRECATKLVEAAHIVIENVDNVDDLKYEH